MEGRRLNILAAAIFPLFIIFSACTTHPGSPDGTESNPSIIENPSQVANPRVNGEGYGGVTRIKIERVSLARISQLSGTTKTIVTLFGENFVAGATVTVNHQICERVQFTSPNEISCSVNGEIPQVTEVVVTAPDRETGTFVASGSTQIPPAPTLSLVSPSSGLVSGGTVISIQGSAFVSGLSVTIGDTNCTPLTYSNAALVSCAVPAKTAGSHAVKISNPDGQSATLVNGFTYIHPVPTISTVTPGTGATAGGTPITIVGSAFQMGATVIVGSTACSSISVIPPNQITCTTPAGTAGSKSVSVQNPDFQSASKANAFVYIAPPAPNSWRPTNTSGAPAGRFAHSSVWTGNVMLIYGGRSGSTILGDGYSYDPVSDSWVLLPALSSPGLRHLHIAIWTGLEMIVWGGTNGLHPALVSAGLQGAVFTPTTGLWRPITNQNAPSYGSRTNTAAVWTGSKMIIWGGFGEGYSRPTDIGIYDPIADTWDTRAAPFSIYGARDHTAVWTGNRVLIWGGDRGGYATQSLCTYDPSNNSWIETIPTNSPSARSVHTAVWTGSRMLIWGGWDSTNTVSLNDGGIYDPQSPSAFIPTSPSGLSARYGHTAVWTGSRMLIWGGPSNTGASFDPIQNTWSPMATTNAPSARYNNQGASVWTGTEFIVFGGDAGGGLATGGRYMP